MGFVDYLLMGFIISGAVYILYRSFWKKKGQCSGCETGTCDIKTIKLKSEGK